MPFIPDEPGKDFAPDVTPVSGFVPEKTWQQKAAAKAPLVAGTVGGVAGIPAGLSQTTGGLSAGWGQMINRIFNPGPVTEKYKKKGGFQKVSEEDLPEFRKEKMENMEKVLGSTATGAFFFDLIQGLVGKPSLTKKATEKVMEKPKEVLGGIDKSKVIGKVATKVRETSKRLSLKNKVGQKIESVSLATETPPIEMADVKQRMMAEAVKRFDGKVRTSVLKEIDKLSDESVPFSTFVTRKQEIPFTKGGTKALALFRKFTGLQKETYGKIIHDISPEIGGLDALYSLLKNKTATKGLNWLLRGAIFKKGLDLFE